jgi:chondroitin 4-sulfotransferase 11
MPIDFDKKTIFVHIPKTAGNSITTALGIPRAVANLSIGTFGELELQHLEAYRIKMIHHLAFADFFKFAILRNPLDRLVSEYFYRVREIEANRGTGIPGLQFDSFTNFVHSVKNLDLNRHRHILFCHFYSQYEYIHDQNGNLLVDFIGIFERLSQDMSKVGEKIGVKLDLPVINQSKHGPSDQYYTPETLEIVQNLYAADFEIYLKYSRTP